MCRVRAGRCFAERTGALAAARKRLSRRASTAGRGPALALVSLAQIDLEANPAAFDSILNLFSNPAAYSGLTDWDLSYVRSLYSYDQERRVALQRNEIVGEMVRQEIDGAD